MRLWKAEKIHSIQDRDNAVREYLQRYITHAKVIEHEMIETDYGALKIYGSSWVPWLDAHVSDRGLWHRDHQRALTSKRLEWHLYANVWTPLWVAERELWNMLR